MPLEDDLKAALTPEPPIRKGELLRSGRAGERLWVNVEGSPLSQQFTCGSDVCHAGPVTVIGDRIFCATSPRTVLSRTLEYSRYRPLGRPAPVSKIKYLYSVVNDTGRDLYVGGYQAEPILVGTVNVNELIINFTNLGGEAWMIDLLSLADSSTSRFISRTDTGDLYTSRLLSGFDDRIARRSLVFGTHHSYVYRLEQPEIEGNPQKYIQVFQGDAVVGNANTGGNSISTINVLPNLSYTFNPLTDLLFWTTGAVNQAGTAGVGAYGPATSFVNRQPADKVAWFDTAIRTTTVPIQFAGFSDRLDCFDDRYTVFDLLTPSVAITTATTVINVTAYSPEGLMLEESPITVFAIPPEQQSGAIVLNASYHPD